MKSATDPEHPDDDLLADLAADVLPTHQARVVEAHVMACARCTSLLTDATHVRNLLLSDDPGPMPPDVVARINQALRSEVATREGVGDHPAPATGNLVAGNAFGGVPPQEPPAPPSARSTPPRVISPWEDTSTIEAFEAARKRQEAQRRTDSRSGDATSDLPTSPTTAGIAAPRSRGPRLARPSRGPSRSRRDLREEVREVKAGRRGMLLASAAGVVVLLGLGGYVVVGLLGNREATTTSAASSGESVPQETAADAAGGPPVLTTGTNYTGADLSQQAKSLLGRTDGPGSQKQAAPRMSQAGEMSSAAVTPGPMPPGASAAADTGNEALRDLAALNGCLSALRAGGRRPVAVDLARYEGRDAAVIVLNGANGGYEVWVVARDCRPGADGTIKYLDLTQ